jgi:hypothetical protein
MYLGSLVNPTYWQMIGLNSNLQKAKVLYQERATEDRQYVVFAACSNWSHKNPNIRVVNHILDADLFDEASNIKDINGWKVAPFNQFYQTNIGYYKKFKDESW